MYIFKYHPDNVIYRNGFYHATYAEFMAQNPMFPLVEGQYFEYGQDKFALINEHGHHINVSTDDYTTLITAINNLE